MASVQDASVGIAVESTFRTVAVPTRFYEFTEESLDWEKNVVQGEGLRVGGRVARSARRVVTTAAGSGDVTVEATSKGMGLLWQACLGTGVSTLVSGTTYQQNFTLGDTLTSLTVQKGLPQIGGAVDAYTFTGCTVDSWEFAFPNAEIATLKASLDIADIVTAQAYAAPSYATTPTLYHFANGTLSTGALTLPTNTTLASAATATANVRSGSISVNNNVAGDRYNLGGAGRKSKPTPGLREITGSLEIEYDQTTYRDLVLSDGALTLVATFTGAALSTGVETLQIVLPEVKLDGALPQANGTDLITQSVDFTCLDNLTSGQVIWVIHRTADAAL